MHKYVCEGLMECMCVCVFVLLRTHIKVRGSCPKWVISTPKMGTGSPRTCLPTLSLPLSLLPPHSYLPSLVYITFSFVLLSTSSIFYGHLGKQIIT